MVHFKPICHYCENSDRVKKHGKGRTGLQRYYCVECGRSFQTRYIYKGNEIRIIQQIKRLNDEGRSPEQISVALQIPVSMVHQTLAAIA